MQGNEERPVEPKWTKLEHILVEAIQDLLIERQAEVADRDVCKVFNNTGCIADSDKEINVPISKKTEKSINRKIKSIKEQAVLSRQFYQIRLRRICLTMNQGIVKGVSPMSVPIKIQRFALSVLRPFRLCIHANSHTFTSRGLAFSHYV